MISAHQNNLVALGCDQSYHRASGDTEQWMTGSFETSEGAMTLSPGGGSYNQDNGTITITAIDGPVVDGIWEETSSAQQCQNGRYYGRFRWTFKPTGFSGAWGYCEAEPSNGWTGTKK